MKLLGRTKEARRVLLHRHTLEQLGWNANIREKSAMLRMHPYTVGAHVACHEPSPTERLCAGRSAAQNACARVRIEAPRLEQVAQAGMWGPLNRDEEASLLFADRPCTNEVGVVDRSTRSDRMA
jgi:hypothetical protein